jgi:hypothetical protein
MNSRADISVTINVALYSLSDIIGRLNRINLQAEGRGFETR